ncbi:uncharacterized protein Z520_09216 [Fonsecaea multimorphosa CBS 102226]|uniref:SGNH hydrolase-type esterase domain-containing protein n=1 Tax=Fonsecaea multimorphosa CBS 102226 TaxID=1442371 RepID=A0A0D2ICS3_9EURO|nr:uncharacterized protein Z520_09216 [Fonsecaea multimorphosa CBS 102226]KIX94906.1 hypothetical protein Z520_09216 [Fonsecaea multimorphosa CBS 102226]OAL20558.1 hypothetical protein AYO22_08567 [Fonsecaea multimorphosa]
MKLSSFAGPLALGASLFVSSTTSTAVPRQSSSQPWSIKNFNSLITFGDSYTDESRLGYFITHNGSAPPAGTLLPETFAAPGGGRTWSRYVVQYTGATVQGKWTPQMTLWFPAIDAFFPSVLEYEVPAFVADIPATRVNSTPAVQLFTPKLTAQDSVYALWIGTNDLGVYTFLTDSQVPGKVLSDYTDCIYSVFDKLYASGGRHFVLMNTVPLNLAPLYANDSLHGIGANQYWANKTANHTEIAYTMQQFTTTVNNVFKYQTPYELLVANRYPGAHFALFDTHSLITDIYNSPAKYLNGTGVVKGGECVWGYENHCTVDQKTCVKRQNGTNPDGYLWFDELHPSEQTDRIIARNFVQVLNGTSQYATYY